jgi:hypothetical protein
VNLTPRAKRTITDGEWIVTLELQVNGEPVGEMGQPLRYADSYMARDPNGVGYLIASRIEELAVKHLPRKRGRK